MNTSEFYNQGGLFISCSSLNSLSFFFCLSEYKFLFFFILHKGKASSQKDLVRLIHLTFAGIATILLYMECLNSLSIIYKEHLSLTTYLLCQVFAYVVCLLLLTFYLTKK